MSNALAIAAVTATLQYYLVNAYTNAPGFAAHIVTVSCSAPDQVQNSFGTSDVENQVNLFLHQVTHNTAWRNSDLASMSADGTRRVSSPPLALNLHYLLTAYGSDDWQAEALLGYALMMLHENPVITRQAIGDAVAKLVGPPAIYPSNPLTPFIASTGVANQIEMIKIVPETLGREEMAWLWTALKADYRPTFPFEVSVLLLEPQLPSSLALPVLQRVFAPQSMKTSQIAAIGYKANQTAALPGDLVTVTGENLTGAARVSITSQRYGIQIFAALAPEVGGGLGFTLPPEGGSPYPAGVYDLTVQFVDPTGKLVEQTTNALPFAISPTIPTQTAASAPVTGTMLTAVTITGIVPPVFAGQSATLALSTTATPLVSKSASAQSFPGSVTSSLTFQFDTGLPAATPLLARLQLDGVTSQIAVDMTVFPPVFKGPWVTL